MHRRRSVDRPQGSPVSAIRYTRNFLTEVIARVDLVSPIERLQKKLPSQLSKAVKRHFPIAEPQTLISREIQVSPETISTKDTQAVEWAFHGSDREKTFKILPSSVLVQYKSYETYERLESEFSSVLAVFFDLYPDAAVSRIGLRYINNIRLEEGEAIDWVNYLNPLLLSSVQFGATSGNLTRAFQVIEYLRNHLRSHEAARSRARRRSMR